MQQISVQERYAKKSICFGCGPANESGLRIRSIEELSLDGTPTGRLVAEFVPLPHHHAFPGVVNGGIIGALLDCHSNWTASMALMRASGVGEPPCTVTSDFHVKLKRPTPMGQPLRLIAKASELQGDRARVEAELWAGEKLCATCTGEFVSVKEGHPAFHRW